MKVSVIIVTFNGEKVISDCLSSVLQSSYPNLEIIVVNNGSLDRTRDIVINHFPQVKLIDAKKNLGFAGGNNLGIKYATGDIIILLNDDTTVKTDWIDAIAKVFNEDKKVGVVGCKILYPDKKTIQHAGGIVRQNGLTEHIGNGELDYGQYDFLKEVDYVTGAAIAFRRELIDILGLLDEKYYPIYFEETDYCFRARKLGYRIIYLPQAVVYHWESQSTVKFSPAFFYNYHKNRIRFLLKNFSFEQLLKAFLVEIRWLSSLSEGVEFSAVCFAYLFNLFKLPFIISDRLNNQRALKKIINEYGAY